MDYLETMTEKIDPPKNCGKVHAGTSKYHNGKETKRELERC